MKTREELVGELDRVRKANGHSMARAAQEMNVSYQTVWLWLRRGQAPTLDNAQAIAAYCAERTAR